MLQMGIGVVDVIMVGNYSSEDLAGVALGSGIWFNLMLFFTGVVFANGPFTAKYFGAQRFGLIGESIWHCFWIALVNSIFAIAMFINIEYFFIWFGVQPTIGAFAADYLLIISFSAFPFIWLNGMRACCESTGNARFITYIYILAFILNAILNYTLIYGVGFFPELGGLGSAWASLIVTWATCGCVFLFLTQSHLRDRLNPFQKIKPNFGLIKQYYIVGFPIGV